MILVTGGLGFLGCNLGHYLAEIGQPCILGRRSTTRVPAFLEPHVGRSVQVTACDVTDRGQLESVVARHGVKSIIHAAHHTRYQDGLDRLLTVNMVGTMNVLAVARAHGLPVTFVSSGTVYFSAPGPWTEDLALPLDGAFATSSSKRAEENLCAVYRTDGGLPIRIVRPPRIYGPLYSSGRNPVQAMIEAAAAGKSVDLSHVDAHAGGDFLFVYDCARATAGVHLAKDLPHHIYNAGGGRYVRYGECADLLRRWAGIDIALGGGSHGPGTQYMRTDRIAADLGFELEYETERGLRAWLDYVQSAGARYLAV